MTYTELPASAYPWKMALGTNGVVIFANPEHAARALVGGRMVIIECGFPAKGSFIVDRAYFAASLESKMRAPIHGPAGADWRES